MKLWPINERRGKRNYPVNAKSWVPAPPTVNLSQGREKKLKKMHENRGITKRLRNLAEVFSTLSRQVARAATTPMVLVGTYAFITEA